MTTDEIPEWAYWSPEDPRWEEIKLHTDPPPQRFYAKCNVCGCQLQTEDEERLGMCERCAAE